MKIRIEETTYEGSAAEILDQLRELSFDSAEFASTKNYIHYLRDNFARMTGLPCELPEGDTETQAGYMLDRLAEIGALELLEDG